MKAEEGEHRKHDDHETYEIDDTVHGSGSLLSVQRLPQWYVPTDREFGMESLAAMRTPLRELPYRQPGGEQLTREATYGQNDSPVEENSS
ncbi:hypothetical protein [Mesorhizobium sp. WSM4313]|uniref:hypothetical protein n=1 Tax=Mesorhizobium sp. WSM4313 TaxID=2029412 RepID=UPI000BAF81CD|nr:hypothetical protein [Mesorhizobium sp. WSM4313]